jgi:N-acylneuraminate cytidylyltransferase
VCVSPTSPLRAVEDVDACIELLLNSDADMVMTVRPAERNPYFNMVVLDGGGYARVVMRPERPIYRRQDAPAVYDITTVAYAFRPAFVLRTTSEFDGKVRAVVVPPERALDIDTELDFAFAEFLLGRAAR